MHFGSAYAKNKDIPDTVSRQILDALKKKWCVYKIMYLFFIEIKSFYVALAILKFNYVETIVNHVELASN